MGGLVFSIDNTLIHGLVCAPNDQSISSTWDDARPHCYAININGYNDWYLPNKNELNQMFTQLHLIGLGGFASVIYWSSTEVDYSTALGQNFNIGSQFYLSKTNTRYVRAVRAF